VKVTVIYESLTGNTRKLASLVAGELAARGHTVLAVSNVLSVDLQALSDADLVVVGSWTDGILVVGQKPGRASRLRKLPVFFGKKAFVYCTYAINPGKTIDKLSAIVHARGGDVVGGLAVRRNDLPQGAKDLVDDLLAAVPA
jgi:hypothetical protein